MAQQCRFPLQGAADDPVSIGGDVVLTRADGQRYKIPTYNLTTGQPLPDVKGGGNLAVNFGNSAFHSLFPEAELITVCVPKPPDRATIGGSFRRLKPIATSDLTVKKTATVAVFAFVENSG